LYTNSDRNHNKGTLKLAETIRAKRQIELQSERYGYLPDYKAKRNLIDYLIYSVSDKNIGSRRLVDSLINYVQEFSRNVLVCEINERWLKDFESYLSAYVTANSVIIYMNALRTVREKIINVNPLLILEQV
jgi:hypothetical protein